MTLFGLGGLLGPIISKKGAEKGAEKDQMKT